MHSICLSPYKNLHILVYVTQPVGVPKKNYGNALIPVFPLVRDMFKRTPFLHKNIYRNAITRCSRSTTSLH